VDPALIALVVAAPVSLVAALAARALGPRLGIVDRPDADLKTHDRPVVPLGGVGVVTGGLVGSVTGGLVGGVTTGFWSTTAAVLIAFALGLADDRFSLQPRLRLAVEAVAAAVLVAGPLVAGRIGWVEAMLGLVAAVVFVNAVNLFDGLDGLVTTAALAGAAFLFALLGATGGTAILAAATTGALLGFLPLNWNPARMFLGDNGSYSVGILLTAGLVEAAAAGGGIPGMAAAAVAGAVFLIDLAITVLRRRRAGVPMFAGDRSHVYDQLRARGWSVRRVAAAAALANAVACGLVLASALVWGLPAAAGVAVGVVVAAIAALVGAGFTRS
jgi:UDP-GlcNAc:undecaprenyl-phosphate GlcNAc-1-phosphate transferase